MYPDKRKFEQIIKRAGLQFKVISYQSSANKYVTTVKSDTGDVLSLRGDDLGGGTVE